MKAYLLAAGMGTRLKPLTDSVPKCLVPIANRPLLDYWMELLAYHGVENVLLNTHYLYEQVREYIALHNAKRGKPIISEFFEPNLLGSGGTVAANSCFVSGESDFYICYADNLTNIDLTAMLSFHKEHNSKFTMALFRTNNPSQCGIASLDEDMKIVEFEEKPIRPKSNLANAGVYIANPEIFDMLPRSKFIDFGKDVLPLMVDRMYGWETKDYLLDVGTLENYQKAQEDIKWITKGK